MDELPPPYVTNERWKAISRSLFQLGSALFGAAAVRLYSNLTFDGALMLWSFAAAALIYSGWQVLMMLEPEK